MLNKKNLLLAFSLLTTIGALNAGGLVEGVLRLPGRAVEGAGIAVEGTGELVEDTNIPVVEQAGTVVRGTGTAVKRTGAALAGDAGKYNDDEDVFVETDANYYAE